MRKKSYSMALGGVTAALAVVIMCLGTLFPLATYLCPVICALILQTVFAACGKRIAWVWFTAVAVLSMLLSPDKEAAAVFAFLGYYPIVKCRLDRSTPRWLWKLLLFNGASITAYAALIWVLGMGELAESFREAGVVLTVVTLALGNLTFLVLDNLLSRLSHLGKHA